MLERQKNYAEKVKQEHKPKLDEQKRGEHHQPETANGQAFIACRSETVVIQPS
jgi:hypothetical protein